MLKKRFERRPSAWTRGLGALAAIVAGAIVLAACGESEGGSDDRPRIVATTPVLGDLTRMVVGDEAEVQVLMPNGADPHEFQASARDATDLRTADLVVENGLGLEAGVADAVDRAGDSGTPTFTITEHVRLRELDTDQGHEDEHKDEDAHKDEDGHSHEAAGGMDPHVWLDPALMATAIPELATAVSEATGIDTDAAAEEAATRLEDLTAELTAEVETIPVAERRLVTGHDSFGYFADRFGFTVIGAVVPSVSTEGAASAGELAELRQLMREEDVGTIVLADTDSPRVAEALARQADAAVAEVPVNTIPDDGTYEDMMRQLVDALVSAISA